ncbi:ribonuclease H-like protein [Calocera cornea HHB12733]|uniref:ribonuclease H n=1 Tax=Calocera cornea HHB12733 TaxID=1353952 RepID=A0A165CPR1_9BASI|nr:ribonuclease H-like protein [Calocera cornea HHB12733]
MRLQATSLPPRKQSPRTKRPKKPKRSSKSSIAPDPTNTRPPINRSSNIVLGRPIPLIQRGLAESSLRLEPPPAKVRLPVASKDVWIDVYTDGACIKNGKYGAKAGLGVYWVSTRNISERVPGAQTNNGAELIAIIRALEEDPAPHSQLCVRTDSKYAIRCVTEWFPHWMRTNFRTSGGGRVQNVELIQWIIALKHDRPGPMKLEYVKAHRGIKGNEMADQLAKAGRDLPWIKDRDWTIRGHDESVQLPETKLASSVQLRENISAASEPACLDTDMFDDVYLLSAEELFYMEAEQTFD